MDVDMESQGTTPYSSPDQYTLSEEADQGWVSWAWSFVPAIVSTEEESEEGVYQQRETGGIPSNPQQHTPKDPIVCIGFYCTKASVTFKVNQLFKCDMKTASSKREVNNSVCNSLACYFYVQESVSILKEDQISQFSTVSFQFQFWYLTTFVGGSHGMSGNSWGNSVYNGCHRISWFKILLTFFFSSATITVYSLPPPLPSLCILYFVVISSLSLKE